MAFAEAAVESVLFVLMSACIARRLHPHRGLQRQMMWCAHLLPQPVGQGAGSGSRAASCSYRTIGQRVCVHSRAMLYPTSRLASEMHLPRRWLKALRLYWRMGPIGISSKDDPSSSWRHRQRDSTPVPS